MSVVALPAAGRRRLLSWRLLDERSLAGLAASGEDGALAEIYRRHGPALYRYARSIVRHEQDAQDVLHSTMTKAFAALPASDREIALKPWLFRIAHNEAISLVRRRPPTAELSDDLAAPDSGTHAKFQTRESLRVLVGDLGQLAERQRAALVMRELNDLSHAEIAQALGVSESAAKQLIYEARLALHELGEGRAMECEAVRRLISDGDRRALRARKVGAHLRACRGCKDFKVGIGARRQDIAALAPPLAPAMLSGLAAQALHARAPDAGGGLGVKLAAAKAITGPVAAKGLATVAAVAVVAAGAGQVLPTGRQGAQRARSDGLAGSRPTARTAPEGRAEHGRAAAATTVRDDSGTSERPATASHGGTGSHIGRGPDLASDSRPGSQPSGGPRATSDRRGSPSHGSAGHRAGRARTGRGRHVATRAHPPGSAPSRPRGTPAHPAKPTSAPPAPAPSPTRPSSDPSSRSSTRGSRAGADTGSAPRSRTSTPTR